MHNACHEIVPCELQKAFLLMKSCQAAVATLHTSRHVTRQMMLHSRLEHTPFWNAHLFYSQYQHSCKGLLVFALRRLTACLTHSGQSQNLTFGRIHATQAKSDQQDTAAKEQSDASSDQLHHSAGSADIPNAQASIVDLAFCGDYG